ncbi:MULTISPECIES: 2-dehydropantoate 2-reductase [unclassified Ruegeria]|uniref:2-dehydropantoate 2-reductase n=1 Tax=unclassified Ruegeria TaxID=2625375 RepID=UPI0014915BDE|nr:MULTISPECIES: 2-dehydropantoate 2-reductase [unclassified Ruegeria]NOD77035.1 2-dehydropantoate 2-reductase [Ruegeria sp. HKCCD4332]NOD89506.1 2-dehydropantoate 2-reductase [Ruegeria sp. HKCCD4318]NOE13829.1 2-dehydropantoate 2-reductase [Ruegeria sp. HKCCD4318-2]NOG08236.1 2-dehydropantoate 2-reductase [Ruegeria sp. HKCCD4315]
MKVVIAGAGSIGCYCGALLARAGRSVTLLGRAYVLDPIRENGLTVTDFGGLDYTAPAGSLALSQDPTCLGHAELIIVTVKSGATADIADQISTEALPDVPVLSWQNGIENAATLRATLPGRDVRAGMVPFNVVPNGPGTYHRATSGEIVIESGPGDLASRLSSPDLPVLASDQIEAVQWGKLLINLNNALNALSGLTIVDQLTNRDWRILVADQMAEALSVLKAAGHPVASTTPLPAWMTPHILRLPTPLFTRIAARMLTIDPSARTSMAYDLMAERQTEIDSLQGHIIRLGRETGVPTPICTQVSDLIKHAPDHPLTPDQIRL